MGSNFKDIQQSTDHVDLSKICIIPYHQKLFSIELEWQITTQCVENVHWYEKLFYGPVCLVNWFVNAIIGLREKVNPLIGWNSVSNNL